MDFTGPVIAGRGAVHEDPLCGCRADRPLASANRKGPARYAPHRKQALHEERGRVNGGEAGRAQEDSLTGPELTGIAKRGADTTTRDMPRSGAGYISR